MPFLDEHQQKDTIALIEKCLLLNETELKNELERLYITFAKQVEEGSRSMHDAAFKLASGVAKFFRNSPQHSHIFDSFPKELDPDTFFKKELGDDDADKELNKFTKKYLAEKEMIDTYLSKAQKEQVKKIVSELGFSDESKIKTELDTIYKPYVTKCLNTDIDEYDNDFVIGIAVATYYLQNPTTNHIVTSFENDFNPRVFIEEYLHGEISDELYQFANRLVQENGLEPVVEDQQPAATEQPKPYLSEEIKAQAEKLISNVAFTDDSKINTMLDTIYKPYLEEDYSEKGVSDVNQLKIGLAVATYFFQNPTSNHIFENFNGRYYPPTYISSYLYDNEADELYQFVNQLVRKDGLEPVPEEVEIEPEQQQNPKKEALNISEDELDGFEIEKDDSDGPQQKYMKVEEPVDEFEGVLVGNDTGNREGEEPLIKTDEKPKKARPIIVDDSPKNYKPVSVDFNENIEKNREIFDDTLITFDNPKTENLQLLPALKFYGKFTDLMKYVQDNSKNPEDPNHVAVAMVELARLEKVIPLRQDGEQFKDGREECLKEIIASTDMSAEVVRNLYKEIYALRNPEKDALNRVQFAQQKYFSEVAKEDRVERKPNEQLFSDLRVITEPDIMGAATSTINTLNQHHANNSLSADNLKYSIERLHFLESAYNAKPWYSKAWSTVIGWITGHSESKSIENLRNTIKETSPFDKALTEKAINAEYQSHLDRIMKVADEKLAEQKLIAEQSRQKVEITEKEMEKPVKKETEPQKENEIQKENEVQKEETKQKVNSEELTKEDMEGFEIEETPEEVKDQIRQEQEAKENDGFEFEKG